MFTNYQTANFIETNKQTNKQGNNVDESCETDQKWQKQTTNEQQLIKQQQTN